MFVPSCTFGRLFWLVGRQYMPISLRLSMSKCVRPGGQPGTREGKGLYPVSHPRHEEESEGVCLRASAHSSFASIPWACFSLSDSLCSSPPPKHSLLDLLGQIQELPPVTCIFGSPWPTTAKVWGEQLLQCAECQTPGHLFPFPSVWRLKLLGTETVRTVLLSHVVQNLALLC